jgi:carboxylesterase type B
MAVKWVRRNIAAFGGDPERISIFGQSASRSSVDYYAHAWAEDPIVAGLISHSGTSLSFVPNTAEESTSYFYTVSKILGCGCADSDADELIKRVRQRPFTDMVKATAKVPAASSPALPQPVFHPTVDGVTGFDNYAERTVAGKFALLVITRLAVSIQNPEKNRHGTAIPNQQQQLRARVLSRQRIWRQRLAHR